MLTAGSFLILVGITLPLVPDQPVMAVTPLTPFHVWLAVVVVCTMSYLTYLLQKYAPARKTTLLPAILIGAFTGAYLSEPMLQGGILLSIFGYMAYLQPFMALVALTVFAPQLVFVPIMQSAINRRVAKRIATLREVSGGMILDVADDGGIAPLDMQKERIEDVFSLNMGIFKLKFSMNFLMNLLYHVGTAGVLATGGWFVVTGQTEVGTVVAFVSGLSRLNDPWGDLVTWFRDLTVTGTKYRLISGAVREIAFHHLPMHVPPVKG